MRVGEFYMISHQDATGRTPYLVRKGVETIKEAVPVEEYGTTLTELRHNRGCCPIHKGDNPEVFAVYPDRQRWYCYRCHKGGDVLDLCQAVEGGSLIDAMVSLSLQFGIDLPRRSERWHERQKEKADIRDNLRRALAKRYRRRIFHMFAHEFDSEEDAQEFWEDLWPTALAMAGMRVAA